MGGRAEALELLKVFAMRHMWRTRQSDVKLPTQSELPCVATSTNIVEFVRIFPDMKEFASGALADVTSWQDDQTTVSQTDLKRLLATDSKLNAMCRAAVSVALAKDGTGKSGGKSHKGNKGKRSASAMTKGLGARDGGGAGEEFMQGKHQGVLALRSIHSVWRQRCASYLTGWVRTQLQMKIKRPVHYSFGVSYFPDADILSYVCIWLRILRTVMRYEASSIHTGRRELYFLFYHLSRVWEMRDSVLLMADLANMWSNDDSKQASGLVLQAVNARKANRKMAKEQAGQKAADQASGAAASSSSSPSSSASASASASASSSTPRSKPMPIPKRKGVRLPFGHPLRQLAILRSETWVACLMATHRRLGAQSPARYISKYVWRHIFSYSRDAISDQVYARSQQILAAPRQDVMAAVNALEASEMETRDATDLIEKCHAYFIATHPQTNINLIADPAAGAGAAAGIPGAGAVPAGAAGPAFGPAAGVIFGPAAGVAFGPAAGVAVAPAAGFGVPTPAAAHVDLTFSSDDEEDYGDGKKGKGQKGKKGGKQDEDDMQDSHVLPPAPLKPSEDSEVPDIASMFRYHVHNAMSSRKKPGATKRLYDLLANAADKRVDAKRQRGSHEDALCVFVNLVLEPCSDPSRVQTRMDQMVQAGMNLLKDIMESRETLRGQADSFLRGITRGDFDRPEARRVDAHLRCDRCGVCKSNSSRLNMRRHMDMMIQFPKAPGCLVCGAISASHVHKAYFNNEIHQPTFMSVALALSLPSFAFVLSNACGGRVVLYRMKIMDTCCPAIGRSLRVLSAEAKALHAACQQALAFIRRGPVELRNFIHPSECFNSSSILPEDEIAKIWKMRKKKIQDTRTITIGDPYR